MVFSKYRSLKAAIKAAETMTSPDVEAQVVAVEKSGTYRSRTVVWPVQGETRTN